MIRRNKPKSKQTWMCHIKGIAKNIHNHHHSDLDDYRTKRWINQKKKRLKKVRLFENENHRWQVQCKMTKKETVCQSKFGANDIRKNVIENNNEKYENSIQCLFVLFNFLFLLKMGWFFQLITEVKDIVILSSIDQLFFIVIRAYSYLDVVWIFSCNLQKLRVWRLFARELWNEINVHTFYSQILFIFLSMWIQQSDVMQKQLTD